MTDLDTYHAAVMVSAPGRGGGRRFITGLGLLAFVGAAVLAVLAATADTLDRELLLWAALTAYLGLRILLRATAAPSGGPGVSSRPFALAVLVAALLPGILAWYVSTDPRRTEHGLDPVLVMWTALAVWFGLLSLRATWTHQRQQTVPGHAPGQPSPLRWVMIVIFSLAPGAAVAWLAWQKDWPGNLVTFSGIILGLGVVALLVAGSARRPAAPGAVPPPFQGGAAPVASAPGVDRVTHLARLREQGLLTDDEFATLAATSDDQEEGGDSRGELVLVATGPYAIKVIKAVRLITGYGLAEAKALVDAASAGPVVIAVGLPAERAQWGYGELQSAGATAQIR